MRPGIGPGFRRYAPPAAAPSFNPLTAFGASLFAWYDASDASTMFQNDNGTTPSGNTDPVGFWGDKSGNANHATQATVSAKPSRSGNVLTFAGDDRIVVAAFAGGTKAQTNTAVVVGAVSNNVGAYFDSAAPRIIMQRAANATTPLIHAGANYSASPSPDLSVRRAVTGVYRGASSEIYVNNVLIGTSGAAGANGFGNISLGGIVGDLMVGELAEVLLINRALTSQERADLHAYLAAKWSL